MKEEGGIVYWTDNILFPKNRFLPVFIKQQIEKEYWVLDFYKFLCII